MRLRLNTILVFALLASGACSSPKRTAESDLATAERAMAALPADAAKIGGRELAPLTEAVNRGRDLIAKGEFASASSVLTTIPAKAQTLAQWLPEQKATLTALMDTLMVAMPRNLDAMRGRLDTIGHQRQLPRGLDEQELQEAKDTYAAAAAEWAEIVKGFKAGELADAMARAQALKDRVSHSLMALGLVSDQRAWSNVTLPPRS
jgi:hypothetical protein